jgi:hypothetical protein
MLAAPRSAAVIFAAPFAIAVLNLVCST